MGTNNSKPRPSSSRTSTSGKKSKGLMFVAVLFAIGSAICFGKWHQAEHGGAWWGGAWWECESGDQPEGDHPADPALLAGGDADGDFLAEGESAAAVVDDLSIAADGAAPEEPERQKVGRGTCRKLCAWCAGCSATALLCATLVQTASLLDSTEPGVAGNDAGKPESSGTLGGIVGVSISPEFGCLLGIPRRKVSIFWR